MVRGLHWDNTRRLEPHTYGTKHKSRTRTEIQMKNIRDWNGTRIRLGYYTQTETGTCRLEL